MSTIQYIWLVLASGIAVVLALAVVVLSVSNASTQRTVQARQLALSNGVLGPQGQQISAAILQDMANASATDPGLRALLKRHGFTVQSGAASNGAPSAATTAAKTGDEVDHE